MKVKMISRRIGLGQEPCDCGDKIRHNNGGNYHQEEQIFQHNHMLFLYETTTRERFSSDSLVFVENTKGELELVREDMVNYSELGLAKNGDKLTKISPSEALNQLKSWYKRGWSVQIYP